MPAFRKTELKNGLRIVSEKRPSVRSIALGVWVDVGSRHEAPDENGITHLIEHMVFKGTRKRSAGQIAASLESLGGALNAFTAREQTCYNARVIDEHLDTAVDVLADISCRASLTPANFKKEKLVICEEIKEVTENPSDHIHDLFAQTFWDGHPLGQPILGSMENVLGMSRAKVVNYIRRHYRSESIVISAAGNIEHDKLVKLVRRNFDFAPGTVAAAPAASAPPDIRIKHSPSDNGQTHFCIGYPGLPFAERDKPAAILLTTYLGGGMSSVLFQKVREQRGLAYSVFAFHDAYRDAGVFGVYMATDKNRLAEAYGVVEKELKKLRTRRIDPARLDRIKNQVRGQISLSLESTPSRMSRLARNELMLGRQVSINQTMKHYDSVTSSRILEAANRMLDDSRLAIATLGPADARIFDHVSRKRP
jgi:predicted Zn-dependent peptidase